MSKKQDIALCLIGGIGAAAFAAITGGLVVAMVTQPLTGVPPFVTYPGAVILGILAVACASASLGAVVVLVKTIRR